MSGKPHRTTFTQFPNAEERARMAGPRRAPRAPRTLLRVDIQATQPARNSDLDNYDLIFDVVPQKVDVNKPLPPVPGEKSNSRRGSKCEAPSTPRTPLDKVAHWVEKKVFTPMKELFHPLEATEMIAPRETQDMSGQASSHRVRVMEKESPPRSRDSHAFFAELHSPRPQADVNRQSRVQPSVDRQATPRHSRGLSSSRVSQRPTMAHRSRASESSMSSSVRTALETSVGTAKDVGHRFGLGHESGRLVFSDAAPPGMMDPCGVCGKEPKGVLYRGKCRDSIFASVP